MGSSVENPFERKNLSDGRSLNRPKVNENNWNMSQKSNHEENEKDTGKSKSENESQQQYTEYSQEEYRGDNGEEMGSGLNGWQSYMWGKGKGKGKSSQEDEHDRRIKAM